MAEITLLNLELACFIIAALYSITGHAGASGYIAVMALLGMAPQEIKPLALTLNLVVSTVATIQFYRAGHFDRKLFLPFVVGSIPFALIGGYVQLPGQWFKWLMGVALIIAALRVVVKQPSVTSQPLPLQACPELVEVGEGWDGDGVYMLQHNGTTPIPTLALPLHPQGVGRGCKAAKAATTTHNGREFHSAPYPTLITAIALGAAIGFISGLIGVGGGIFLTPLLLLAGWATAKQAAAVSAPFILFNSLAALAGLSAKATQFLPDNILYLVVTVLMGGLLGSFMGSRTFAQQTITRVLSAILLIAGAKLLYV